MKKTAAFLSLIVYGPLLLNQGIFWDDWTIFNMTKEGIDDQVWGAGSYPIISSFHYFLQQTTYPVLTYHLLSIGASILRVVFFNLQFAIFLTGGSSSLFGRAAIYSNWKTPNI